MSIAKYASAILLFVGGTLLGGCGTTVAKKVDNDIQDTQNRQTQAVESVEGDMDGRRSLVREEDAVYVSPKSVEISKKLPPIFDERVVFQEAVPVPVSVAAERISSASGFRTIVSREVYEYLDSIKELSGNDDSDSSDTSETAAASTAGLGQGLGPKIPLTHTGTLASVLDRVAAALNSYWRFEEDTATIWIYRYDTRTFRVAATNAVLQASADLSNTSSTGDSADAAQGGSSVQSETQFDVYQSIQQDIEAMLSTDGKMSISPDVAQLTVTDTPEVMAKVERYMEDLNKALTQEVLIEVEVLSVTLNDEDARGINWDAVYTTGDSGQFNLGSNSGITNPIGTITGAVLPTATGKAEKFRDTSVIIDNLATQGDVSVETTATLRTLNNRPVPMSVGDRISYVSSSSTTINDSASSNSTELSEISVGFSLNLNPHILEDAETILMQLGINISQLNELKTITSGDNIVQAPNISSRDILQSVSLTSGETLVLSGFERITGNLDRRALGPSPWWWPFGGGRDVQDKKEVIVVLLRPFVVDGSEKNFARR